MRKIILTFLTISIGNTCVINAQSNINKILKKAKKSTSSVLASTTGTNSNDEIINGLKEALTIGTNNSTTTVSKVDGFFKNPAIKIPFPKEALAIQNTLEGFGMKPQIDQFVLTLNRAAEDAAKNAAPIFINAIKTITINDGLSLLKGADNAATNYLKDKTTTELHEKFKPIVMASLQKVQITKYWKPLVTKYNKIPLVQKQNPDLEEYVTQKSLDGLFNLIAGEELKIRKDPAARVNDLLKNVFGNIANK